MAARRSSPYVWVTWLPKLLTGESNCEWAAWFRAHHTQYDKVPNSFDFNAWGLDHTALVNATRAKAEESGYAVTTEDQNKFALRGSNDITLGGKPDLIAVKGDSAIVIDAKTGARRDSHAVQVLIYMWAMPLAFPQFRGVRFRGRVAYKDGTRIQIAAEELDDSFRTRLVDLIRRVGDPEPSRRVPSARECSFCDIPDSECDERVVSAEPPVVDTDAF